MATREDKRAKDAAGEGIDPRELEICLEVLGEVDALPVEHPDAIALQRATASSSRPSRSAGGARGGRDLGHRPRRAGRAPPPPRRAASTTRRRASPLVSAAAGASAGTLMRARPCYVCKQRYTQVDAFYHQLCPACAALHHASAATRAPT